MTVTRYEKAWWYLAGWEDARGCRLELVHPLMGGGMSYLDMFATYADNMADDYNMGLRMSLPSISRQWEMFRAGEKLVQVLTVQLPPEPTVQASSELGAGYYALSAAVDSICSYSDLDPAATRASLLAGVIITVQGVDWALMEENTQQEDDR